MLVFLNGSIVEYIFYYWDIFSNIFHFHAEDRIDYKKKTSKKWIVQDGFRVLRKNSLKIMNTSVESYATGAIAYDRFQVILKDTIIKSNFCFVI